jgi:hypothetical protein
MVNFPQIGTAAAALPFIIAASPAGALPREFQPSPNYPLDQPTLPTKPTPGRAEIAGLSRLLIADAKPLVVAQVAPSDGQLANSVVRPYGIDAAGQISDLELQRRQNNQQLNDGLEGHNQFQNDALNRILKRTGK